MNLGQIKARLVTGVARSDIASLHTDFVNEALREIQRRRSFAKMKTISSITITNGTTSAALPSTFKELTTERSPIHVVDDDSVLVPCEVWPREKVLRRGSRLLFSTLLVPTGQRRTSMPVFMTYSSSLWRLNIYDAATEDLTFSVSHFGYLSDLSSDSDSNFLTDEYPEMVINKAKAIAFASVNDPVTADLETLYERDFKRAAAHDAYQALAGIELRM